LEKIIAIEKERMRKLSDFPELARFFFELQDYPKELLIWKDVPLQEIKANLEKIIELLQVIPPKKFTKELIEPLLIKLTEERGRGEVFWPLRVALSGKDASPGPLELLDIFGKKESLRRIKIAIKKLET